MNSIQYRGITAILLAQLGLFLADPTVAKQLRGRRQEENDGLTCRITVLNSLHERPDGSMTNEKEICCIPLEEESYESGDLYPIDLPSYILDEYQETIDQGELFLSLQGATIHDDAVLLEDNTEFTVLDDMAVAGRRLDRKEYDNAVGTRTLKVIRVSAADVEPFYSADEMEDRIFQQNIGLSAQYDACSFGQLKWESRGVLDVNVDGNITEYGSASALRVAAEQKMKELNIISSSTEELADNVMFCMAPGTGSWVANAGTKYWRSQYNDKWCLSLTATMHEVAHNLGLGHSNHNGQAYADETGYMAAAWMDPDWPRKCFNGVNHDQLGWYASRTMAFDPIVDGPRKVKLATFVDYMKTSANEPVLVRLGEKFVLQYNMAKGFNEGTEEMRNKVTIVAKTNAGTDLKTGLSVGEKYVIQNFLDSDENVVIEICENQSNDVPTAPDIMVVGVSVVGNKSACDLKLYQGQENGENPELSTEKTPTPIVPSQSPGASDAPTETSTSDRQSIPVSSRFRDATTSFLLAWETVALRTTWFKYLINRYSYHRQDQSI